VANFVTFGVHFAALTEFPVAMAEAPYSLSAGMIGVAYLAYGVSGLIASPLGGMLSDRAAAAHPAEPEARLIHNMLITLLVMPTSLLLFAWSAHWHMHIVAPLVGMFGIGFACAALLPGVFSFCTTLKQSEAAGAAAMIQTMMFVASGVLILVSAVVVRAIGLGPWFSILAGVQLLCTLFAFLQIIRKRRAAAASKPSLPHDDVAAGAVSV
jgi:MFS family permease